jgi:hypothetical protein
MEVEGLRLRHRGEDRRRLPAGVSQPLAQQGLLLRHALSGHSAVVPNREDHHGDVVPNGNPYSLETHLGVHHGDEFVSWPVSLDIEYRDHDVEIPLELLVWAEGQPAHS